MFHNRGMSETNRNEQDRRVKRTKALIFEAFFEMVQSSRYDELKTIHIIEKSGVGKSTFYEHFNGKDDVLSQSLEHPMSVLAMALVGDGDEENIKWVLNHFWERRLFARLILQHPTLTVVDNCLRDIIISNSAGRASSNQIYAQACFLSSGFLSLLAEWLTGKIKFSVDDMLEMINMLSSNKD